MRAQAIAFAKKFDEEHGPSMVDGFWLIFEDGSTREINPMGASLSVSDPYEKSKGIVKYWQLKYDLAAEEFQNLKAGLANAAMTRQRASFPGPPPSQEQIDRLKEIKKKVKKYAKKYNEAAAVLEKHIPQGMRDLERRDTENRESCGSFLDEISKIEI